jgi:hypothetical protein
MLELECAVHPHPHVRRPGPVLHFLTSQYAADRVSRVQPAVGVYRTCASLFDPLRLQVRIRQLILSVLLAITINAMREVLPVDGSAIGSPDRK